MLQHMRSKGLLFLFVLAALTIFFTRGPRPYPLDSSNNLFSAQRALKLLKKISVEPHPVGSDAIEKVRNTIEQELQDLGLDTEIQPSIYAVTEMGWIRGATVKNIVAKIPGTANTKAVLLAAHYDSVPHSRGASDDGSGVVTLLETARAILNSERPKNDIILLFTEAEEEGLLGAGSFVKNLHSDIGLVLNFEARGACGPSAMFETSSPNRFWISEFAKAAPNPIGNSLISSLAKALPNDTDFTMFRRAGIPGLNFAYADCLQRYHTYFDSTDTVDPASIQHQGSYALSLTRHFGNLDLNTVPQLKDDLIYFDVFGKFVVRYPKWVAIVLSSLLLLAFGFLCWRSKVLELREIRQIRQGSFAFLTSVAFAVVFSSLLGWALASFKDPTLILSFSGYFFLNLLLISLTLAGYCHKRLTQKITTTHAALGAQFLWLLLAVFTSVFAPGASFLFQWPLFFVLLGQIAGFYFKEKDRILIASFIPAVVLMTSITYMVFIMAGLTYGAPTLFAALLLGLLLAIQKIPEEAILLTAAAFSGSLLVLGLAIVRPTDSQPIYDSVVYGLEPETGQAYWISFDSVGAIKLDEFVSQFIPKSKNRRTFPEFFPLTESFSYAPAPTSKAPTSLLRVLSDRQDSNQERVLELLYTPTDRVRCANLWKESDKELLGEPSVKILATSIQDQPIDLLFRFSPELDKKLWGWMSGQSDEITWKLHFCAFPEQGLKIKLKLEAGKRLKLRLVETLDGLPPPELFLYEQRSAEHAPSTGSDRKLISRHFEF